MPFAQHHPVVVDVLGHVGPRAQGCELAAEDHLAVGWLPDNLHRGLVGGCACVGMCVGIPVCIYMRVCVRVCVGASRAR